MRVFLWVWVLVFSAAVPLQAKLTSSQNPLQKTYTVQSGDTLYSIAHKHHTTIRELLSANGLEKNTVIKVGQVLSVPLDTYFPERDSAQAQSSPSDTPSALSEESPTAYTVRSGDTLYTIAREHHVTIKAILQANELDRHSIIKVGQHLTIPVGSPASGEKRRHTQKATARVVPTTTQLSKKAPKGSYIVQEGDTLFSIARKNHIVISKLMALNHLGLTDRLRVGQVLNVSAQGNFVATVPEKKAAKQKKRPAVPIGAMPSYTVKKGDTLWRIAQKHHLTLAQIRKLNKNIKGQVTMTT